MKKQFLILLGFLLFGCSRNEFSETNKTNQAQKNEQTYTQMSGNKKKAIEYSLNKDQHSTDGPIKEQNTNTLYQNQKKESVVLDVPMIKQNPELKYGCEVTSLAMVLNYAGVKTNKMELYNEIEKDSDPQIRSSNGDIVKWGNPAEGFVGDMTGKTAGYAVFDVPMINLMNKKLPGRAVNLTNHPFEKIQEHVSAGYPVVVWTTGDYKLPDQWEAWNHGQQTIKTPIDLHAVVLVGYDKNYVYLNDPLSGIKQAKAAKEQFISSWKGLNCRAVSYR